MTEMATGFHRETATIYQFPVGGRAGVSKFRTNGLSDLEREAREIEKLIVELGPNLHVV